MKITVLRIKAILGRMLTVGTLLFVLLLSPSITYPGEWRVSPIRLDLGREAKSGVITVINEKAEKLQVQMKAFEWTQDAEGKDIYTDTDDLIFFPKIIVFEKNEERIVRAGIKVPAVAREKTYRLFIEEIPEPKKAEGVNVALAIRFGVPIFVRPLKEEAKGEISKIEMSKGALNVLIRNTGNLHLIISTVTIKGTDAKGEEIFSRDLAGWYLLSGASRLYTTLLSQDVCKDIARFSIEVKTDKFVLNGSRDADKTMCPE